MSHFGKRFGAFGPGKKGGGHNMTLKASLNLTPMIDMMTIILVFLIKTYSVSPEYLTPTQGIQLSATTSETAAPDRAVLFVGKDGILIEGQTVFAFNNGTPDNKFFSQDTVPGLLKALGDLMKRSQKKEGAGTLILQADREVPFTWLKPILRTAGLAGFNDIKFAGNYAE